ncbi:efflux RND transporter permease subunit [Gilvimarinus algae]|uniref:MMPL family transporter n=1 Tax=Gilvimarinus algae TaxID=3058037 RepID=A0ABT8TBB3_9GAMM|nr:MMPL family transporter [Gilvimarinus sp. SDUM040014]MDO3380920.1 MMPL family transporter [Gilvimarinus sp. SDUM040014]
MGTYFQTVEFGASKLARWIIRHRWAAICFSLALAIVVGSGASQLEFSTNYRVFFSSANPELQAFENLQNTYAKNDNFLFVIVTKQGRVFDPQTLLAVEELTERAWKIPYAIRVDSITNFQYSYARGDDLVVEDLISKPAERPVAYLRSREQIAMDEPLLRNQLLSPDGLATAVNVVLQYPEVGHMEVPESVSVAREIRDALAKNYPGMDFHITGVSMLNNAFAETGMLDGQTLIPIMFGLIFLAVWMVLRSLVGSLVVFSVITLSTVVAMGYAGFIGIKLTPISMSAPIIVLTLAIADSIHILISYRGLMREGMNKIDALVEAVRVNFLPVTITSLTTIVGFLMLNFSDSPPYWHLGNMTAVGIGSAWFYSLVLIPALFSMLRYSAAENSDALRSQRWMESFANFVIARRKPLLVAISLGTAMLVSFIPQLNFNDQWVKYFDESIEFRRDSDSAQQYFGLYPIEFSVPAMGPGGISEPEYLHNLEDFADFLRGQKIVSHVYSISDIMKRLNRNMHRDQSDYYRIPNDRELSAQYLLLYELSLPYGLDLNDRINIDKSASRITATLDRSGTDEAKAFFVATQNWQTQHWPKYMRAEPTSASVMFTYIAQRNFDNMIIGTALGIGAIAIIMMLSLRSFGLGLLSLIPNSLPILAAFGAWALLVGEVGFSVATVASISLGIVVDDTVHFLAKYLRGRRERGLSREDAIRYAFQSVGHAIIVNTVILSLGFLVLYSSAFKLNADLGLMTLLSINFALILDFLLLPALLLLKTEKKSSLDRVSLISGDTETN